MRIGEGLDGIEVVRVLDLKPHPNADKIQLVDVDRGDGEALQICCGAFNMGVGDLVPLATLGTVMPGGMKIERRKLRGEWSNGMLCSGRELGTSDDHGGILVLDPALALGTPIREALGVVADVLWELEVNPNRPDAMNVVGLARDVAPKVGVGFVAPAPPESVPAGDAITWASGGSGERRRPSPPSDRSASTWRTRWAAAASSPASSPAWTRAPRHRRGCSSAWRTSACARSQPWSTSRTTSCSSSASRTTPTTSAPVRGTHASGAPSGSGRADHHARRRGACPQRRRPRDLRRR
ncbi:MAG: hypothetical protein R2701_05585 [Acidimicrobiales bacterium]